MTIKAKKLVLELVTAAEEGVVPAREIIAASGVFGITDNNVRVTLARLVGEGLLETVARGVYRLSPRARAQADLVGAWRFKSARTAPWGGGYVGILWTRPARADTLAPGWQRGLDLAGFRELRDSLYVRPDNLGEDLPDLARRLRLDALGSDAAPTLLAIDRFDAGTAARLPELWDTERLDRTYRFDTPRLVEWLDRVGIDSLQTDGRLRESFLLGADAIRNVAFDPLLPAEMVDTAARAAYFEAAREFYARGQELWRQFRHSLA